MYEASLIDHSAERWWLSLVGCSCRRDVVGVDVARGRIILGGLSALTAFDNNRRSLIPAPFLVSTYIFSHFDRRILKKINLNRTGWHSLLLPPYLSTTPNTPKTRTEAPQPWSKSAK